MPSPSILMSLLFSLGLSLHAQAAPTQDGQQGKHLKNPPAWTKIQPDRAAPFLDVNLMVKSYTEANSRLISLDYDGTLTPTVYDPESVRPTPELKNDLRILASTPGTQAYIVTARSRKYLDKYLGDIQDLGFFAEFGSFYKQPGGQWVDNTLGHVDLEYMKIAQEAMKPYLGYLSESFIETQERIACWHYRKASEGHETEAENLAVRLQAELNKIFKADPKYGAEALINSYVVEVKPVAVNKGKAVEQLIAMEFKNGAKPQVVIDAGDGGSDEPMHLQLREATGYGPDQLFSIMIGQTSRLTHANYHVNTVEQMTSALHSLAMAVSSRAGSNTVQGSGTDSSTGGGNRPSASSFSQEPLPPAGFLYE
ncbi:MAG: threalose-6-phosphate phosphatase [Trizodia sp. TS-e1964]|nr:MAG: threalose-6-phosphate phosphatase [Trizodia sp. TS-e1964]